MFDNIGSKIKILAKVISILGVIVSVVSGFALIVFTSLDVEGVLLVILGSLISWASSFVLYGFGQLIKNVEEINNKLTPKKTIINNNKVRNENIVINDLSDEECYSFAVNITSKMSKTDYRLLTDKYKIWYDQIKNYSLPTLYNIIRKEQSEWQEEYIQLCCFEILNKLENKTKN